MSGALAAAPYAARGLSASPTLAATAVHVTAPASRAASAPVSPAVTGGAAAQSPAQQARSYPVRTGYQPRHAAAAGSSAQQNSSQQDAAASAGGQPGLACSASGGGMLPQNYATIVRFLTAHGYTGLAAAGIAGNIFQESGGNPESVGSGGGGLIGFTPLPSGLVTGNPSADLQAQLEAILSYNQQWAAYIPALNSATSAVQAADIYMDDFERPGIPMAGNREAAAAAVAQACGL